MGRRGRRWWKVDCGTCVNGVAIKTVGAPDSFHAYTKTLREGKKRQVRHMTAAVGHPTLRLLRVAVGPLQLGSLQPGQWRDATPAEMQALRGILRATGPRSRPGRSPRSRKKRKS